MGISAALGSSALLPAGLGFRNVIINGGFDVWQRTTSSEYAASATAEYKAPDRWWTAQLSTTSTLIVSRQTADTTNFNYGCRVQRKSGQTGTGVIYLGQTLETVTSKSCAGRQVTLSFYAKKGANAVSTFEAIVYGGKGTDQTSASLFSTGWTSGASLLSQTVTPTTTMTRYTYTFAVDSTYTQLALWFKWTPSGTAGADDWFQFEGVQLEQNYQPTPFEQRPIGVELALCQRYYRRSTLQTAYGPFNALSAYVDTTTTANIILQMPVPLRTSAVASLSIDTSSLSTINILAMDAATSSTPSALTIATHQGRSAIALTCTTASAFYTTTKSYMLRGNNDSTAYIGISAEL